MSDLRKAAQMALGVFVSGPDVDPIFVGETIDALRAALAQPEQEIAQAIEAEREACAKVCDQRKLTTPEWQMDQHYNQAASHCAQAIRLRGRT